MDVGAIILAIAEGIGANILYDGKDNICAKKRLESELEEILHASMIFFEDKVCNEVFYNDLQKVFIRDKWLERILYYYFGMGEMHSCEYMIKSLVKDFLQEYSKWSVYEKRITDSVMDLQRELFNKLSRAKYIPDVNKLMGVIQNNTNLIVEKMAENTEYIIQAIGHLDTIADGKYKKAVTRDEADRDGNGINKFEMNLKIDNESYRHNYVACQLIREQDYIGAIKETDMLLSQYPNDVCGLYNSAIANYQKIISEKNTYLIHHDGFLPKNNLDYSVVIDRISRAFEVAGAEDADVLNFYGFIMMISEKNIDLPEKLFFMGIGRSLEKNDEVALADAWANLALYYLIQKDFMQCKMALKHCEENKFTKAIMGNMYAMLGVEEKEKAIAIFRELYEETKESGFLMNIEALNQGEYFDSVYVNGAYVEIYSDEELLRR